MKKIEHIIKSNVFLYKIWFYSIRIRTGDYVRLPSKNDDLYFDGYPRSGNTFCKGLLSLAYPQKKFASHLHSISGLKIALKFELPIFIIIRKPEDAVVSNLFTKVKNKKKELNQRTIENLLASYQQYYSFVRKYLGTFNIISFDSFIKSEVLTIERIAAAANFDAKSRKFLQETLDGFRIHMERKETQKETFASSLPNNDRAEFKNKYQGKVLNAPTYQLTTEIYRELINYDLVKQERTEIRR